MKFEETQVVSGSFGKVYLNGNEIGEISEFECKLKLESKDVILFGGEKGKKNTGSSLEIKLKFQKVYSYELDILKSVKNRKLNTMVDINVQLDDPEALGAEAVAFKSAKFTGDIDILSFKRGELVDRELNLTALPSNVDILEDIQYI